MSAKECDYQSNKQQNSKHGLDSILPCTLSAENRATVVPLRVGGSRVIKLRDSQSLLQEVCISDKRNKPIMPRFEENDNTFWEELSKPGAIL